jgi:RNA polymerase sigma-70 factor (ECF subfamily)
MTIKELEQITLYSLKEGNVEAFNLCYDLYYRPLCSYANFIVKNPDSAEEIIQNIFMEIWMNREKLPENSSFKAYILTAVRNDCLDYLKHKKTVEKYAGLRIREKVVEYDDIFSRLIDKELQVYLNQAIEKLPEGCRKVFELSRFHYNSYKEIAEKLNISIKTVENQIGKALKIVRKELEPYL